MSNHSTIPSTDATAIERHVGARIRERRTLLGLTQQTLAERIGVTYQQAHKYERGINRVSAGRLFMIAEVLGVGIAYFYEDLQAPKTVPPARRQALNTARMIAEAEPELQRKLYEIVRLLTNRGLIAEAPIEGEAA